METYSSIRDILRTLIQLESTKRPRAPRMHHSLRNPLMIEPMDLHRPISTSRHNARDTDIPSLFQSYPPATEDPCDHQSTHSTKYPEKGS